MSSTVRHCTTCNEKTIRRRNTQIRVQNRSQLADVASVCVEDHGRGYSTVQILVQDSTLHYSTGSGSELRRESTHILRRSDATHADKHCSTVLVDDRTSGNVRTPPLRIRMNAPSLWRSILISTRTQVLPNYQLTSGWQPVALGSAPLLSPRFRR